MEGVEVGGVTCLESLAIPVSRFGGTSGDVADAVAAKSSLGATNTINAKAMIPIAMIPAPVAAMIDTSRQLTLGLDD